MKNLLKLLLLFCTFPSLNAQSDCSHGESYTELDINNISAGLLQGGGLWWNGSDGRYFAKPEAGEEEVQAIYRGGLWLGGEHLDGSTRVAAVTYGHIPGLNKADFFPGPIRTATGTVQPEDCTNWDKHFKILQSEIDFHIADYMVDSQVDSLNPAVYSWPAKDNPHFLEYNGYELPIGQELAPFIDNNGDNIYNPDDGDYPDIKGDQAIWWVFNDIANAHTSSGSEPIGVEVQAVAYAYQSSEHAIDNTTFYDFKLKYYGEETLENFHTSLWMDVDLGCYTDDRFGIDTSKNMTYYYNADFVDGDAFDVCPDGVQTYGMEIPMLGVKLLNDSENTGVTSFIYNTGSSLGFPDFNTAEPGTPAQYQHFMSGRWRSNNPMTYGENGVSQESTDTTTFVFSGNPSLETEWSICSASPNINTDLDFKTILSSGGTPLYSGDVREWSYAVIFVPDVPHPCPDLTDICGAADIVQEFSGLTGGHSSEKINEDLQLKISPNPARERFLISLVNEETRIKKIEIIDLPGRVYSEINNLNALNYTVRRTNRIKGIYFVKVTTTDGKVGVEKVVFQ